MTVKQQQARAQVFVHTPRTSGTAMQSGMAERVETPGRKAGRAAAVCQIATCYRVFSSSDNDSKHETIKQSSLVNHKNSPYFNLLRPTICQNRVLRVASSQ